MTQGIGVILCLAYILGLLSTAVSWVVYAALLAGIGIAVFLHRRFGEHLPLPWQIRVKPQQWLLATVVGFLAILYFQARVPHPAADDISQFVLPTDATNQEQVVTINGNVTSTPRVTRSQRGQFWLAATQLDEVTSGDNHPADVSKRVTGKLYVTVPLLQTTGLHQGQEIAVTGILYQPKPVANPGSYDFKASLEREGSFAGLSGYQVSFPDDQEQPKWGWWKVTTRIVRSQARWLGSPEGPLVSAMVLGNRAVDLPSDIRDLFIQTGLAHALAASGFQTSMILALLLSLGRRLSGRTQLILGCMALFLYVNLTGYQPPVVRAAVMGVGALIALAMKRKVRPLGSLLLAATILLLLNPLWIWDLGFQLSFLATLGLLVTVPPLTKYLDWLPPAIATLIAVPIAGSIWTLPLQLHLFGVVPLYSIVVNILATPLIAVMSIGGIFSAMVALIWPLAGSTMAWLLYYPTHWLIGLVQFFSQLPGNSVAVGTISVLQLLVLYSLIGLTWLQSWWQRRWWLAGFIGVALVLIPVWQNQALTFRATVLAAAAEPILVIQDQGQVTLVNSGDPDTVRFTVLPFLQQQGINQINSAIATDSRFGNLSGWLNILQRLPIKNFYHHPSTQNNASGIQAIQTTLQQHQGTYQPLTVGGTLPIGSTSVKLIEAEPPVLQLQIHGQTWLWLGDLELSEQKKLVTTGNLPNAEVLWWSGELLASELLKAVKPQVAIASSAILDADTASGLRQRKIEVLWTGRDGAIQWTPDSKFEAKLEATENHAIL